MNSSGRERILSGTDILLSPWSPQIGGGGGERGKKGKKKEEVRKEGECEKYKKIRGGGGEFFLERTPFFPRAPKKRGGGGRKS